MECLNLKGLHAADPGSLEAIQVDKAMGIIIARRTMMTKITNYKQLDRLLLHPWATNAEKREESMTLMSQDGFKYNTASLRSGIPPIS